MTDSTAPSWGSWLKGWIPGMGGSTSEEGAGSQPIPEAAVKPTVAKAIGDIQDIEDLKKGRRKVGSLIPETLSEMDKLPTPAERKEILMRQKRSLDDLGLPDYAKTLEKHGSMAPERDIVTTVNLNIGLTCNQACTHCHVESSPKSKETTSHEVALRLIELLKASPNVKLLDITGGAPEMHEEFKFLVEEVTKLGIMVQDRCNLTVLLEPGYEDLAQYLADHRVVVCASLPCYEERNVTAQRGAGVFERSIAGLRELNDVGYGMPDTGLKLFLVYNPGGAFLPPPQEKLEAAYKQRLMDDFGIEFTGLYTMTNMPIKRYVDFLKKEKKLDTYCNMLVENFNPEAANNTMCRNTVSVRWDGTLFDCDFNLALELPKDAHPTIYNFNSFDDLTKDTIASGSHCFGCAAGAGSS